MIDMKEGVTVALPVPEQCKSAGGDLGHCFDWAFRPAHRGARDCRFGLHSSVDVQ